MSTPRLATYLISSALVLGCASAPVVQPEPVGLTGLPAQITVNEWPFWVDIPYVRTEWRPVDLAVTLHTGLKTMQGRPIESENSTSEQRYTFRIRQSESKIRMGIEARLMPSQRWAVGLKNIPNAPWVGIHRELQDRLVVR